MSRVSSILAAIGCLLAGLAAAPAQAAPEVDLHDLDFYIHVDLIDAGAGRDLAFWQGVVDDAVARGNELLVGANGPADTPCCTKLTSSASLQTFGTPGDGLEVIDSLADQQWLAAFGLPGSRAFLVDTIDYCNGPGGAIGCASVGPCGNPNDDPNLWLYVEVFGFTAGEVSTTLPAVLAHERGHNSCLNHVAANDCQLMQATVVTPGMGGCLTASECTAIRNGRTQTSSGDFCACHADGGGALDEGAVCDASGGICSGGRCGSIQGDAGVALIAAADPGEPGLAPEHALRLSALTGDWNDLGQIGPAAEDVRAMAWAEDGQTLYGVVPTVSNDQIVTIDPETGALIASIGSIVNSASEIVSMAYDPGATSAPGDDRLIVLEVSQSGSFFVGDFLSISPATPSSTTFLGDLGGGASGSADDLTGLAYDSAQGKLFLSSPFGPHGIWEVDMNGACPPSPCTATQLSGDELLFRYDSSLAYSRSTGMLYLVGTSTNDEPFVRTFLNVIDPTTGATVETLSLDRFKPAALAAVPEPGIVIGVTAGALALALTARHRENRRG